MAAFIRVVSAINCNINPGDCILAVTTKTSINYTIIKMNNDSAYIKNKTSLTNLAKKSTDQQ